MNERIYGPAITLFVGLLFVWLLLTGFRRGVMEWPYFGINLSGRRSDQPVRFWAVTVGVALIASMALFATVLQILWPRGV